MAMTERQKDKMLEMQDKLGEYMEQMDTLLEMATAEEQRALTQAMGKLDDAYMIIGTQFG